MIFRLPNAAQRIKPAILLAFALAFSAGVATGYVRWHRPATNNKVYRALVIREQARELPEGGVLVIGDSLIERQRQPDFCGLPTLNAGIGGATSGELLALVADLAPARPKRLVINAGANDMLQGVPPAQLQDNIERMLGAFEGVAAIVVGVPGGGPADEALRAAAQPTNATFLPWPVLQSEDTIDGLHLAPSGSVKWSRAVARAFGCERNTAFPALGATAAAPENG